MVDKGIGDYFISDADDEAFEDDDLLGAPVVVPVVPQRVVEQAPAMQPAPAVQSVAVTPAPAPVAQPAYVAPVAAPVAGERPPVTTRQATREELLAQALDDLMHNDPDIQAAALVSLDGFTMASALPEKMASALRARLA